MRQTDKINEITVEGLKVVIEAGADFALVDVREKDEYKRASIPGSILVPMSEIGQKGLSALPTTINATDKVIVHCHHGGRSAQVVQWLLEKGFQDVSNLIGGIDTWSLKIDSTVPRY